MFISVPPIKAIVETGASVDPLLSPKPLGPRLKRWRARASVGSGLTTVRGEPLVAVRNTDRD